MPVFIYTFCNNLIILKLKRILLRNYYNININKLLLLYIFT